VDRGCCLHEVCPSPSYRYVHTLTLLPEKRRREEPMETADTSDPLSSSSDSEIVQVMENPKRKLLYTYTAWAFGNFIVKSGILPKGVSAHIP
jgi:hypothetical protein